MTMVTNASPRAGAKPNRQQRRQAARVAKKGRRSNGAAAPTNAVLQEAVKLHKAGQPAAAEPVATVPVSFSMTSERGEFPPPHSFQGLMTSDGG